MMGAASCLISAGGMKGQVSPHLASIYSSLDRTRTFRRELLNVLYASIERRCPELRLSSGTHMIASITSSLTSPAPSVPADYL